MSRSFIRTLDLGIMKPKHQRNTRSCRSIGPILVHPPFSTEDDYDELADWLEHRRIGITDIVELEGFLTALVIGPNAVSPIVWLPKVWGGRKPKFTDLAEMNRFVALVMGLFNDIVFCFEQAPQEFQPNFYESKVKGRRIIIVDEWCWGFLERIASRYQRLKAFEARAS